MLLSTMAAAYNMRFLSYSMFSETLRVEMNGGTLTCVETGQINVPLHFQCRGRWPRQHWPELLDWGSSAKTKEVVRHQDDR